MGKLSPFSLGFSGCLTTAAWMLLILGGSDRRGDSREYSKSLPFWSVAAERLSKSSELWLLPDKQAVDFSAFSQIDVNNPETYAKLRAINRDDCTSDRERERDWLLQGWEMLQVLRARFKWQVLVDAYEIVGASSAIAKRAFPHTAVGQGLRFTLL